MKEQIKKKLSAERPNVVFIIADDHRGESIGAFGNETVQTPVLDSLAASGTSCRNTHIFGGLTGAVCAPSRACVNTGISIFRAMIGKDMMNREHSSVIRPDVRLMPQTKREAGYQTHAVGKWHNDKASFARSFEGGDKLLFHGMSEHTKVPVHDYDPSGAYPKEQEYIERTFSTELFTDSAVKFIEDYREDRPFFLYVAYTAPHDPRTAPEPYASMYDKAAIPLPPNFMREHPFDTGDMMVRDEKLAIMPRDEGEIREHIADYYAMISHLDAQIGRVVEALKAKGIYDDTLIVYTADHGLAVGQHGLMGKQNVYEHSVRIPLIFRGPGVPENKQELALASNIDIFPTVAGLCNIDLPEETEGVSLCPIFAGKSDGVRGIVCSVYRDTQRMITDGRWKLIRYYRSPLTNTGTERIQLFDLLNDPWETQDLSAEPANAGEIERLASGLALWMQASSDILQNKPVIPVTS
ncbi:sulfatase-like hydrolase/transferase [Paenibacillus radicis (ex Xue et al. 2023)]|uniref:Sulfatase-like hydrolase/transferase n=1 Tax=Paenibacillus radicis (ex Xue et al. 2023) TaxID=2972489 RepID=A0ABT1YNG3_9BACL|nr:sulfatase-like hydrolase/transferase [Paenibacillus radicis (ex Xue et al. 2023)]MCR8634719.1 sulfatase-like hydrolase/transferase [Paenibacillus radicis (ex Xue et al. 2023)]